MDEKNINAIISRYPYPIAILYRIVAGMDLKEEPAKGLEYILQTAEAIARLLGIIALSELTLLKEQQDIDIPAGVKSEFRKNIKRPSFGIWLGFAREGFAFFKKSGAQTIIPELNELFYNGRKETEFKIALDKLIKLRNAIAHRKVVLDTIDKQQTAVQISLNYLHTALTGLDFLKQVSFGYIKSIEVNKKRRQNPEFLHKGKLLTGDSIGKGINLSSVQDEFKETDTVIIRYDRSRYLNLYPFYIYDESSGDAVDVFFYNGMDKKRLEYIGIDPGGKFFVENQAPEESLDMDAEFDLLMSGGGMKTDENNIKYSPELHGEFAHITYLMDK